jgi:hypothetical protein
MKYSDADNATIIRPVSDAPRWTVNGATSAAAALAHNVTQPDPVPATSYIWAGAPEASVTVEFPSAQMSSFPAECKAWFYANTGSDTELVAEAATAGQTQAATIVSPGSGFAWYSISFSVSGEQAAADLQLRFTTATGSDSNVRAAYVEYPGVIQMPPGHVTVVGPNLKVQPTTQTHGDTIASIIGAGNEFVSLQIVVPAVDTMLTGLVASVPEPLTGAGAQIPATDVRLYREAYYKVRPGEKSGPDGGEGLWPDALVPVADPFYPSENRGAFPIDVPAGENRAISVDVFIPGGHPAWGLYGHYSSKNRRVDRRCPNSADGHRLYPAGNSPSAQLIYDDFDYTGTGPHR